MTEDKPKPRSSEDADIEREIRSKRDYSLAEAIGRAADDLLKGHSPVTMKRQAELVIGHHLETHLTDSEGALSLVLARRVTASEVLLGSGYERPLDALIQVTEHILGSTERLNRFVRAVDMEWGLIYSERPFFESAGRPSHPEDPYTRESVRLTLTGLLEVLRKEASDRPEGGSGQ